MQICARTALPILASLVAVSTTCGVLENVRAEGKPLDRVGTLWAPYIEWSLEHPTFEGHAFDVIATATFVHEQSGEKRMTGMFYDGCTAWKFRFISTRTDMWSFTTSSPDEDLDSKKGKVLVEPNPSPNVTGWPL